MPSAKVAEDFFRQHSQPALLANSEPGYLSRKTNGLVDSSPAYGV
jgi:hypothetical protein